MYRYIALLFVALSIGAAAQNLQLGVTHYAWAAQGSNYGSDSVHVFGTIPMNDKDSVQFQIETEDSVRFTVLLTAVNGITSSDTLNTKVTGQASTTVLFHESTIPTVSRVGWHNIVAAFGGKYTVCDAIKVSVRIWAVGTEVQKSKKRMKVKAKVFR